MNKFDVMNNDALRRYFLANRNDESFHAYMDRRYAHPHRRSISADDPEWESKVIASIKKQLGETNDR